MNKPNAWDRAKKLRLIRREPGALKGVPIDPGTNFFVAMLDQLRCPTYFSCEGHPKGFYIMFRATYLMATVLSKIGYFKYSIHGQEKWIMDTDDDAHERAVGKLTKVSRAKQMRYAADAWEKALGKLDFRSIKKEI